MRYVVDIYEIEKHPAPLPTCEQVADTLRHVFVPLAVECPDGVAYMPVPRCETCAHWHGGAEGSNETKERKTCVAPTACGDQMDEFMTLPDFGCVLWKAKS